MTTHHFTPSHYHTALGAHEPVLRIADGDTVITTTVDAMGKDASDSKATPGGNPQTGPFYVEGAEPGDTRKMSSIPGSRASCRWAGRWPSGRWMWGAEPRR